MLGRIGGPFFFDAHKRGGAIDGHFPVGSLASRLHCHSLERCRVGLEWGVEWGRMGRVRLECGRGSYKVVSVELMGYSGYKAGVLLLA